MSIPVITPFFFREFVDVKSPDGGRGITTIVISPQSIDYVVKLNTPAVVKRLIEITDTIVYNRALIEDPEREKEFEQNSKMLTERYPIMEHYWNIRTLMMSVLQNTGLTLDRRFLVLNYAVKSIQGMCDQFQQDNILSFSRSITDTADLTPVLKYFDGIPVNPAYSLVDGVNFLKAFEKTTEWKRVMERLYKNLGISGPETLNLVDLKKYVEKRKNFAEIYLETRKNIMENIMINYLWTFVIPFAVPEMSMWDNFVFYTGLFNAIKVLVTVCEPRDDDDLAELISCFDRTLTATNKDNKFAGRFMHAAKMSGHNGNGDMAILTIS
jgi:hypothetical protein